VCGYAVGVVALWLALQLLTDRLWPVTVLAFGPRWVALVPAFPLAAAIVVDGRRYWRAVVLAATVMLATIGVMDARIGLQRASGEAMLRVMTHNLGGSVARAAALDRLMRAERVDIALLQECPFYDNGPAQYGWRFFYGGDLCVVSRYPFVVVGVSDPEHLWQSDRRQPLRIRVDTPAGPLQILNVHLATVREALDALGREGLFAIPQFTSSREAADEESRAARSLIRHPAEPTIVAGDFNLPIESVMYRDHWGDLANAFSRCGRGLGHTKFTRLFGVRIDHVLSTVGVDCTDARVLPSPYGGDHRPLVVGLRWSLDVGAPVKSQTG
jgi:endonuclease/exonuclease/phosphatase (EEP) superfamily protein YafD